MSDIVKYTQGYLATPSGKDRAANTLMLVGAGGTALGVAAFLLPVINLPFLLVVTLLAGIALKVK